jgi:hypothetical protein
MGFIDHIHNHHRYNISNFTPFMDGGEIIGYIHVKRIEILLSSKLNIFDLSNDKAILFKNHLNNIQAKSEAMNELGHYLVEMGEVVALRDEKYTASLNFLAPPLFYFDRAMVSYLGLRARGVHINGYVNKSDGIHMWIAKRSNIKPISPGKLDNMIAGGQPSHITLKENIIKEGWEEAGFNEKIMNRAIPVGALRYCYQEGMNFKRDEMFLYDLLLNDTEIPTVIDGEVENFTLYPIKDVYNIVKNNMTVFKDNCNLVIIDFLIRHGILSPDGEADYCDIICGLAKK